MEGNNTASDAFRNAGIATDPKSKNMMIELPKALWAIDYDEDLTFEMLRERFFPEFPKSIFYTRKALPSSVPDTRWIRKASGNITEKGVRFFCMKGQFEVRDGDKKPKWKLHLREGEYAQIPGGSFETKVVDSETEYFMVFERPPHNKCIESSMKSGYNKTE